ncbi:hypothetical protein EV195_10949 [Tenacibaculum skagerrakense]|uniref:Uncharacterized protein n=1 Tax=Tenacibaculum skagerrakense TaxID=186571 RepID=A0A4R2NPW0_9FLAO|nr:hypothetical protein [Tenacibaculum skagerrakense]TCP23325.1 hypothetical protein EV195_10949 [Tenacibaculum skagerrakense]
MKKILILLFVCLLLNNCTRNKKVLDYKKIEMVEKSIQRILKLETNKKVENCYLVNPNINILSIEEYSEQTKTSLLKKLEWNKEDFKKLSNELYRKHHGVYYQQLANLSNCKSSYSVITISCLNDEFLLIKLEDTYGKTALDSLKSGFKIPVSQAKLYSFIFNERGEILHDSQDIIFYN